MAPSWKRGEHLHPMFLAQSRPEDLLRAFSLRCFSLPTSSKAITTSPRGQRRWQCEAELLQLGRKDTKGQWVNQEGGEVPHQAAFHPPSAWRPHRNGNGPGWIRTVDRAAAVAVPSYPQPPEMMGNPFSKNPQACQESKEHRLYTRNHEQS